MEGSRPKVMGFGCVMWKHASDRADALGKRRCVLCDRNFGHVRLPQTGRFGEAASPLLMSRPRL